jgi:hypothetical protein
MKKEAESHEKEKTPTLNDHAKLAPAVPRSRWLSSNQTSFRFDRLRYKHVPAISAGINRRRILRVMEARWIGRYIGLLKNSKRYRLHTPESEAEMEARLLEMKSQSKKFRESLITLTGTRSIRGKEIFVYYNIRTNQVIYSMSRAIDVRLLLHPLNVYPPLISVIYRMTGAII